LLAGDGNHQSANRQSAIPISNRQSALRESAICNRQSAIEARPQPYRLVGNLKALLIFATATTAVPKMRHTRALRRIVISATNAAVLALSLALVACGSSGKTFTSPTPVSKCAVSFDPPASPLPASGGGGAINIKTERECQWTAQPDVSWLNITAGASGQGDGTVQFNAAANADPVARIGAIMLNGLRAQLTQAAGECRYQLSEPSTSLGQTGGTGHVDVRASSGLCTWTASSDADWIAITSGANGKGSAPVVFNVLPTTGPPRSGTLTIAGLHFNVTQAEGCTYAIAPTTFAVGASGGSNVVTVTAGTGCPWTATSDVSWITLTAATGTGNGTVGFTAAPSTGPLRTGTLTIAGNVFTVTQSPGCTFDVSPLADTADASGGARSVSVNTATGCTWTASSNDDWLAISSATSGSGPATVSFTIAATNGPARTGTLTIAGQNVTVSQSPGCSFEVSPLTIAADASGGTRTVNVDTAAGCAWSASTKDSWTVISSATSVSGPGTVTFRIAATNGPARTTTLTIAGQAVTVTQSPGCSFTVSPLNINVDASGGTRTINVNVAAGCTWTASTRDQWITITAGASVTGPGTVTFTVAPTNGPTRSATISVAGQNVTVIQGQGCTFTISPETQSVPASGGSGTISVTSGPGCQWTATTDASWIAFTSATTGAGNGSVTFNVAPTNGPARVGHVSINGRIFTVNQGQGCIISLPVTSATAPAGGATGAFDVRTAEGCAWNAASSDRSWLTVTGGGSGSGNGTVAYSAAANAGAQRSATITVNGQIFTVTQDGGCTYSIAPTSQNVGSGGDNVSVAVTAPQECSWTTSTPNVPWIAVSSGNTGSGNGTVQLAIAPNGDVQRQGTITIAGQPFTVIQASGCTISISPTSQSVPSGGGSGSFNVNATGTCGWNANAPSVPWIHITSAVSGAGPATLQFTVDPNTGGARSGTITVAGQTFTVNQDGGCNPTVTPDTIAEPAAGGSQTVSITTSPDCSWTAAVSNDTFWIAIAGASSGSGTGTVQLGIQPNSGPPRTGTATIAGRTVTVNQDGVCSVTLTPSTQSIPVGGGSGEVRVDASGGCAWTAVSTAWIRITDGGSGNGGGRVQFTVDANTTGAPRSGTITVNGQVSTVNQAGPDE
jgi:hypothetical protein